MKKDPLIGRQLDEYRLEALQGQGGMARVYRGLDVRLKRWAAIKVIDAPFRADSDYAMRFEREAQAIAQLEHPHIVRLYRYGEVKGLLYMAMQYIEGAPLNQVLATYRDDGEFIEPAEAGRIIREVCLALDYAHSQGVIHRDVKPSSIILDKQGRAILADFGLALLTDEGTQGEIFGTPHYMAPEQAMSSANAGPQSDLYAVGVMLYEMFTGQLPFDAPQPLDVAMLHLTEPPPKPRKIRPALSPKLEAVILKALAKEPKDRYRSGVVLANALDKAWQNVPTKTPAHPSKSRSIPERVAVSLAQRPLPPLPAAIIEEAVPPAAPQPAPRAHAHRASGAVKTAPAAASPRRRSVLYWVWGLSLVISLTLSAVAFMASLSLWSHQDESAIPGQTVPAASTGVAAPPTAATRPTPTETPGLPATATPLPSPQLLTDTSLNFSTTPGGAWEYLWSKPDQNKFEPLKFEQRQYGACWYAEDYIRICPDSGHPGNGADIAWRWTSPVSGRVQAQLSAHKIDSGGDGVILMAYQNNFDRPIQSQILEPKDTLGGFQKNFFETEMKAGDTLYFVLKKNGNAQSDHTALQLQLYLVGPAQ